MNASESRRDPELHQLDPTGRFSDRAEDYRRYRPDYPAAAIDAILAGLAPPERLVAADVGAGTGISARQLAERGVRVLAIEPNAAMREAAEPHPRIEWLDGTAESTGLAAGSVDLVLCAQAFHWFRHPEALAEFHRILRAGARMALIWNTRDRSDPLTLGYIEAILAVNGEHPAERRPLDFSAAVAASGRFGELRLETFGHGQELDLAGLIGRAESASYVPKEGAASERLHELLAALFERHRDARGRVTMRYRTQVYLAERR
jgi:SAM-dependent methyltransferase